MLPDVCALVRRDHEDLDRALAAMVDMQTPVAELTTLLDLFKLALAVHVAAQSRIFASLMNVVPGAQGVRRIASCVRDEHVEQQAATDSLAVLRPGSEAWYTRALELRILVLDHTTRADVQRWTLQDLVPAAVHRSLAGEYATERLRVLARTSPSAIARAHLAERVA